MANRVGDIIWIEKGYLSLLTSKIKLFLIHIQQTKFISFSQANKTSKCFKINKKLKILVTSFFSNFGAKIPDHHGKSGSSIENRNAESRNTLGLSLIEMILYCSRGV